MNQWNDINPQRSIHNITKHNKTMCIFMGCTIFSDVYHPSGLNTLIITNLPSPSPSNLPNWPPSKMCTTCCCYGMLIHRVHYVPRIMLWFVRPSSIYQNDAYALNIHTVHAKIMHIVCLFIQNILRNKLTICKLWCFGSDCFHSRFTSSALGQSPLLVKEP